MPYDWLGSFTQHLFRYLKDNAALSCSGHGAMQENYYLDDGAYSAVRCVIELVRTAKEGGGRDITALLRELKEPVESREYRLKVKTIVLP